MSNLLAADIGLPEGFNAFRFPGGTIRVEAPGGLSVDVAMPYGTVSHAAARKLVLDAVAAKEKAVGK